MKLRCVAIVLCSISVSCGGCDDEPKSTTDAGSDAGADAGSDAGSDAGVRDAGTDVADSSDASSGTDVEGDFGAGTPGEPWVDVTPGGRAPVESRYPEMVWDEARQQVVLVTNAQTWVWDEDVWVKVADGPEPANRERFAMAYDPERERVVLFGGWTQGTLDLYGDTWTWDGTTWSEETPASAPPATFDHEMAWDPTSQRVILYGGGGQAGLPRYEDTWSWDGTTWTMLETAVGTGPQAALDMVTDSGRGVAVLYGSGGSGIAGIWEFGGAAWARADDGATGPSLRNGPALLYDASRQATLLVSGYTGAEYLQDTWSWDGTAWTDITSEVGEIYKGRFDHAAAFDGATGEAMFFGGYGLPEVIGSTLFDETFVLRDGEWVDVSPDASPPPLTGNAMTYDSEREEIVLYGGSASSGGRSNRSTWTWDGTFWRRRDFESLPLGRNLPAMAFDAVRKEVVLYGGAANGPDDETFTWDGTSWTLANSGTGPTGPGFPRMVWDAAREEIILHSLESTWTWNGVEWTLVDEGNSLGLAGVASMVYDPVRQAPVLIGTVIAPGGGFDTAAWEWDGTIWLRIEVATPAGIARNYSASFWDPVRDSIVVFGGSDDRTVARGDTVELFGDTWRDLTPTVSPSARQQHGMAYDYSRRRGVLFGGSGTTGATWEWNGAAARVGE